MKKSEVEVCEQALHHFGIKHQVEKMAEEAVELADASFKLNKDWTWGVYQDHFLEELVDVEIVSKQMKMLFTMEEFEEMMAKKIDRLKKYMEEGHE